MSRSALIVSLLLLAGTTACSHDAEQPNPQPTTVLPTLPTLGEPDLGASQPEKKP